MLLRPLSVAAGLLAVPAAHAFLLPPEVSDADIQIANTLEMIAPQRAESQVVELECPDCPILVRGKHGEAVEIQIDRPSHLEMTFAVDHQPDHDRLLVNGFELYPSRDPVHDAIFAPQVIDRPDAEKDTEKRHRDGKHHRRPHHLVPQPQRLGWVLHAGRPKRDADGVFELVEIELQIIEVGYTFVNGVPNVKVKLIKDSNGRLVISEIDKSESKIILDLPNNKAKECTTMLCRMIAMAREKLKKFKSFGHCPGKMKGMHPAAGEAPNAHPHQDSHPDGSAGEEWSPVPYRAHSWAKLFKNIGSHILLPVLIGIVAGVSVSIIGMAVGTVLVSLWRVFRRRRSHRHRHSGRAHHRAARKEAALNSEEKSGLMEDQDAPPAYEEEDTTKAAQV